MLSHPEHLTREQQYHLVQLQSQEHRPFRLIGIGDTSLVELYRQQPYHRGALLLLCNDTNRLPAINSTPR